jgi:HK97 family phage portal protein
METLDLIPKRKARGWWSKAVDALRTKAASLSYVSGSRGWWPLIRELTTGGWQRNEDVAVDTALSNPTLFACVTTIAGDVAKLEPKLIERDSAGIWNDVESPAFSPVLRKPNHYQTTPDFFEWWFISKLVHGNTYAIKARDGRGVVVALYILDPNRVTPLVAPDSSIFYQLSRDELSRVEGSLVVPAREIIHDVECPLFHALCGVSPIYAAGYPAVQGLNIRRSSDKFFANGSRPGGVLSSPLPISQPTADRIKAYWESEFTGDNVGKIAILGDGLKYEAMAMSAEQSQLVEQLKFSDKDIARCYGVPWHKVGIEGAPATSVEFLESQYYKNCIQKRLVKTEAKLTEGLELPNQPGRLVRVWFERDDLLELDTATKMDAAERSIRSGATPNEVRKRWLDLGPVDGGSMVYMQRQNWPLQMLGADSTPPDPTPPADAPADAPETPDQATAEQGAKAIDTFKKVLAA